MIDKVSQKKHVVIIGGGFGGLNAAKVLSKNSKLNITLIDQTNHHLFQPLLYQVATAALSPSDIAMPIREIFRDLSNVTTLMGVVVSINKKEKFVLLENNQKIQFDALIVSVGTRHSYFGKDDWENFAPGLKTLQDAVHIRETILASFELAERSNDKAVQQKYLSFIVIGGGPTGVEMAGAIAEIAHQSLRKNFRKIDPSHAKIYLIEGGQQLLAGYPAHFAKRAQLDLQKMGVTVLLNKKVSDIKFDRVLCADELLTAHNIVWAAGNQASPLLKTLDEQLDKQGRVIVESDLSIKDEPNIFVIGDAACVLNNLSMPLPAVAPVAVQQGKYVGKIISKNIIKEKRKAFKYVDRGMMAVIGKYKALVLSGPLRSAGFIAWLGWSFVHIFFLIGYRTKLFVFSQWAFYFFHGQRNIRLLFKALQTKSEKL